MDPVSGAIIGAGVSELLVVARNITNIIIMSKSTCKEIKEKILCLKPNIDHISKLSSDSYPHREQQLTNFQSQLQDGLHLVQKFEKIGNFNLYRKYRYGKKILKLEKKINAFMITQGMANIMFDVQKLDVDLKGYSQIFDCLEEMGRQIINSVNTRMTNDAESNSLMLQHMGTDQILFDKDEGTNVEEASGFGAQVPDLPTFVVGLNNFISDVKRILFQDGVDIVGIKGMGGSGKSTLVLAVCKDTQVKDYFQNNIIFITVSRHPNVKALLETMWDKLIGRQRPGFQSIEEAHQQLQTNLKLRPCKSTLVVLDDVWSRSNLEDLLFEAK